MTCLLYICSLKVRKDMFSIISVTYIFLHFTLDEEISKMTEWLKSNHTPVEKVKDFMRNTQPKRAEWLQKNKSTTSLSEFLSTYPRLLDTPGMVRYSI